MSWEFQGAQRHIFSTRFGISILLRACCTCKMLCMACASEFFFRHFLMRYQFISFHFFPSFAIVFTFVNVVLCIHRFGFCRSHRFNRCVRPSICPELIVSQTVSIEFNLVSKIHRKKQRNEWERKKLNME